MSEETNGEAVRQPIISEGPQRSVVQLIPIESEVVDFLVRLHDNLYRKNADLIKVLYEQELNVITEKYFKTSRWPSIADVAGFYTQSGRFHSLIMALYSEIYYRHAFYLGEANFEDRVDSWNKYVRLLSYFIEECDKPEGSDGLSSLVIPPSWVWDMLDEFVYQLQESCRWRARLSTSRESNAESGAEVTEIEKKLSEAQKIWSVPTALELLLKLANNPLFKRVNGADASTLNYQLGHFATISLLRLHVLLGDYYTSLVMASNIDMSPKSLYWKVPACHVTLIYYLGFSFMMLRRYNDAIRILSQLLIFLSKQRSYLVSQSYQQNSMSKQTEKMYLIIILCHTITRIKLYEIIMQTVKEQYANRFYQLQTDNEEAFKDAFLKACPKFIDPSMELCGSTDPSPYIAEPVHRQVQIFLEEINKQRKVDEIYSYAKLYHNISLTKLATLVNIEDIELLRSYVLCVKHLLRQFVSNPYSLYHSDLLQTFGDHDDIYIDQNVLHIKGKQNQKIYTEYFLQQLSKCKATLKSLQSKKDEQKTKKDSE